MCPPPPTSVRSYTLQVVRGNADTFWKFQRYHLIVKYHERPALAPPFILLSHLNLVLKRFFRKEAQQKRRAWVRLGLDSAAQTKGGGWGGPWAWGGAARPGRVCSDPAGWRTTGRAPPAWLCPRGCLAFPERDLPEPLGGGAEGELPERAEEAEEGQRGGAAAEDGPQVRGPSLAPPPRGGRGRRLGVLSPRGGLQGQGPRLERWSPPLQGAGK